MRTKIFMSLAMVLLFSCGTLQKTNVQEQHMPTLGDVGTHTMTLFQSTFQKIGSPVLQMPVSLSAIAVPFTKTKFKAYETLKKSQGKEPEVIYIDSVPNKPKYLCLELTDRIGMVEALNNETNNGVRSYLEKEDRARLVVQIAIVPNAQQWGLLMHGEALSLTMNKNGVAALEVRTGNNSAHIPLSMLDKFDYKTLGFCWGEDLRGKTLIETLTDSGRCREGTEKNAKKFKETQSYFKL